MPRSLALYITGLVAFGAAALIATSLVIPVGLGIGIGLFRDYPTLDQLAGLAFWTALTLLASALPVQMPRGSFVNTSIAPIVAAMALGGPTAAAWVALIGTTEYRELSGRVPWYGTLVNHVGLMLPAIVGGIATRGIQIALGPAVESVPILGFLAVVGGASVFFALNVSFTAITVALKSHQAIWSVLAGDLPAFFLNFVALVPLAWLMAEIFGIRDVGWWATILFVLPVYIMRAALRQVVEMREMFTQTIDALAGAVDARDVYTSNHSHRVQTIAVDIGRVMKLPEHEIEALEWGGLLHDIGKIGVPDSVLLNPGKLTREERASMNAHPVKGAAIVAKVEKLAPELPIIRHHHEWYNGSGYPDRLMGDEIPKLARVLHVADAFEAMIAQRPYRMNPLSHEQAIAELRKFSGIQFDPVVVDAFVKTKWADGFGDFNRSHPMRTVPYLAQAASRMAPPPGDAAPADAS